MKTAYQFEKQQAAGWTNCAYVAVDEKQLAVLKSKTYVDDDGSPFCDTLGTIEEFASELGISEVKWAEMLADTAAVACPIRVKAHTS